MHSDSSYVLTLSKLAIVNYNLSFMFVFLFRVISWILRAYAWIGFGEDFTIGIWDVNNLEWC